MTIAEIEAVIEAAREMLECWVDYLHGPITDDDLQPVIDFRDALAALPPDWKQLLEAGSEGTER